MDDRQDMGDGEAWRPVAGYEGRYEVSDLGRVRSLRAGRVMANVTVSDGYQGVKLYRAGKHQSCRIHRLVCEMFNGPAPEGHQVAHLDGDKLNNCASNLAWRTPKANTADKRIHGTHQAGEKHPRAKLTAEDVQAIRASTKSRAEIAAEFGISYWTVKQLRHRNSGRWSEANQSTEPVPVSAVPEPAAIARSDLFAISSAVISPCERYRYRLERGGPGEGCTVVIMVNPSTADAEQDDATIRKLKGFGARNGWGRIIVGNLFAYRATDVRELATADDPVGPLNDMYLATMENEADRVIVAWGPVTKVPQRLRTRWLGVIGNMLMRTQVYSIGTPAKCGHPKHPLMLAYDTPIVPWTHHDILTRTT